MNGVSITRGSPRKHVWTFVAAVLENSFLSSGIHECPCAPNSPISSPSFVGNDYFCESGAEFFDLTTFHADDPLWDGEDCGVIEQVCCQAHGLPWFRKPFSQPTTDFIELRICANSNINNEDIPVSFYDIYVK